jgi:S-adenosylmethionine:tRNA ribosyltransferase-isomerase
MARPGEQLVDHRWHPLMGRLPAQRALRPAQIPKIASPKCRFDDDASILIDDLDETRHELGRHGPCIDGRVNYFCGMRIPDWLRHISPADYTYELPAGRIAEFPLEQRDAAKLLHYDRGDIHDRVFHALPEMLPKGTMLARNNTKVVPARLTFQRPTGARVEVFLLKPVEGTIAGALNAMSPRRWWAMVGKSRRWKAGEALHLDAPGGVQLSAHRPDPSKPKVVELSWTPPELSFGRVLEIVGQTPLPPYIKREAVASDRERYQTVYAKAEGSVAAPTAGLHMTPQVEDALAKEGISKLEITLHVGAGTFKPITTDSLMDHEMHWEQIEIARPAIEAIHHQMSQGKPLVALGTTSLRLLESLYWFGARLRPSDDVAELSVGQWEPYAQPADAPAADAMSNILRWMDASGKEVLTGATQLFILPGYRIRMAEGLITNFHQPSSTLLMLVAAFVGDDWQRIYRHALANDYRFLSYGDSSLLWAPRR